MKKLRLAVYCILLAGMFFTAALVTVHAEQKSISEKLIRLHVIANSDSQEDQAVKLQVRDAIIEVLEENTWANLEEAQNWIHANLHVLRQTAEHALEAAGQAEAIAVSLTRETYPTREYESFSLPAGEYWSLRVVIGQGQGKNWWCVVYPSLCRKASGAMEVAAASAGFSKNEVQFITEDSISVKIKFKILEIFKKFRLFS